MVAVLSLVEMRKLVGAELVAHSQGLADGKNELVSGVLCSEEAELV